MLINVSIERIVKMRYSSSAYIDAMRYDERENFLAAQSGSPGRSALRE